MKKKEVAKKLGIVALATVLGLSGTVAAVYADAQEPGDVPQETYESEVSYDTEESKGLETTMKVYQYDFQTEEGKTYKKISFEYPKAEGDSEAAKTFNNFYQKLFIKWKKSTKQNLEEAKELVSEREDDSCYSDEVACEITSDDKNYISVLQSGYDYMMGAHGMPYRYSYIFDVNSGKKVSAAKLLGMTKKELNTKVRKLYLKKYDKNPEEFLGEREEIQKILDTINFNENCYYIKNGKVRFYVDPYALAPYAAGFIEVAIKL